MNRLLRLTRIAALAITAAIGFATFVPTQAEARQERGWVGGQGADHHYRPIRQVRREQRLHQRHYAPRRHYAPIYHAPSYRQPVYRQQVYHRQVYQRPAPVYYQRSHYSAYGYQQHCEVKKRWRGLNRVRKVVCY